MFTIVASSITINCAMPMTTRSSHRRGSGPASLAARFPLLMLTSVMTRGRALPAETVRRPR